jgi:CRISPR/Cas system-associated exonuclease Cas4 (RecB family)
MKVLNTLPIEELNQPYNLLSLLEDSWINAGYETTNEENLFKYKAFKLLQYYSENPKDIGIDNLLISSTLKIKLPNNLTISSKIDKVYERADSGLEVVDYKTGSNINSCLNFNSNIQLPIYLLLVHDKFNIYPKAISYYYLRHNKKFTYFITKADIKNALPLVENMFTKIKTEKLFSCTPTPYCKDYCECFSSCKSFR